MIVAICLISLFIAIPGFINKAGYSFFKGLIPGYNIYLFLSLIEFPPILLILMALGLIFLPDRMFVLTLICVILPFMVNDAYGGKKIGSLLTLFLPFLMYPVIAYFTGVYTYDVIAQEKNFVGRHKILCLLIVIFSLFMYSNFTRLVEENTLIDRNDMHYVNEFYMSNGEIYKKKLNDNEKKMYRLMLENAREFNSTITINMHEYGCSDYNVCGGYIARAHEAILVDHPELVNYAGYMWIYTNSEGFKLKLKFAVSNPITAKIGEIKIRRSIDSIKKETKDMSDIEKIRYVYEWIGDNNRYDHTFTYASKNQSIYNVFMKKNAVCAGFAKASQVIFQNIGIESYTITGYSTGLHMWNVVKLDDKYYFFDSTVAASSKDKSLDSYYNGLKQDYMSFYTVDYVDWYPEIAKENGLYNEK